MTNKYLKVRAELLDLLRWFFTTRGFTEVQTPVATHEVIPERHIEPFRTCDGRYLQASPEMAMKRLLCLGSGPIFQIGPAFRAEEAGRLHAPEFTMVEWYRPGNGMLAGMDLLDELCQAVLGTPRCERMSYRDAFWNACQVDPLNATSAMLSQAASEAGVSVDSPDSLDRNGWLNLLMSLAIEPRFTDGPPTILRHFPADQAALATTTVDELGIEVAERFELYYRGVELANGYHELTDAGELRARLELVNDQREDDGRERLPMPEELLALMESRGLPPCAGVALGFDRLLMLKVGAESIAEVM